MPVRHLLELLEASPAFQCRPPDHRAAVHTLVGILAANPQGRSEGELVREASRSLPRSEKTCKLLGRTLRSWAIFRPRPDGTYVLGNPAFYSRPRRGLPVTVIDLEATGGRPPIHRFIELALVRRNLDGSHDEFSSLADPGRPLPPYITKVTGIRAGDLQNRPAPDSVFTRAHPWLSESLLVFHGSPADMEYLNYEAYRATSRFLPNMIVCTAVLAKEASPGLMTMGLDSVLLHFGVKVEVLHRALEDARLTLDLFEILEEKLERLGYTRLIDLAGFQGQLSPPAVWGTNLSVELFNGLPDREGAYVLRDEDRRTLHTSFSRNLRRELQDYFYAAGALPDQVRRWVRQTAFLDYLEWDGRSKPAHMIDTLLRKIQDDRR